MKIRNFLALPVVICLSLVLAVLSQHAFSITLSATSNSRSGSITINISGLASDPNCNSSNTVTLYETKSGTSGLSATTVAGGQLKLYRETGSYSFYATQNRADFTSVSSPNGATYYCKDRSSPDSTLSVAVSLNRENPAQFDNLRPFVTLNSPPAGQGLVSGTVYPITISAVDTGGSISRVEVRDGTTFLGNAQSSGNSMYTFNWTPTTSSSTPVYKVLTATAFDNEGASTSLSQTYLVSQNGVLATTSQSIDFSKYDVYYGDFNNDGNANDIYVYGRDTFILLYGDVSVPIILQGPPSYVFYEKSDHSHDDAEILEFADYSWQSKAQKASPQDFTQGDLTGDGTADLLIRGRGQYDTALLVNGKLVQDGADLVPAYLGDID
ncbi:MAG TPA: Ig-like domain-containing protein, partial [Marinagarivorans sp.]|nr:Ig-like domain-containing protein [Marinagarivorans sp.]